MMRKHYRLIPHTADIAIMVDAKSLEKLYSNSARALFDILVGVDSIKHRMEKKVSVEGVDRDDLLIRFLNELIYIFSTERIILSSFKIIRLKSRELICMAKGERFDSLKGVKNEIKAATYCDFKIEKKRGGYKARVIFDV
ncbi:MAG: archease [Candidatus Kaelpia imicola]|nr:archease [Candidatus Kaelpia imicola]